MLSGTSLSADPGLVAKAIAEATDDVIFAKGLDRRYQFANPAMLAAVGCTREQVIGHTSLEFGLWVDNAERAELYRKLKEGHGELDRHVGRRRDGHSRPHEHTRHLQDHHGLLRPGGPLVRHRPPLGRPRHLLPAGRPVDAGGPRGRHAVPPPEQRVGGDPEPGQRPRE